MHEIGVREVIQFAGMTFNEETLIMTWITMAVVLLIAILATRNLQLIPSGWQNVLEMVVVWLHEQMDATLGPKGRWLAPMIITLFLFLLVSNWIGLVPKMASPTNDLNTTLGLALFVVALVHGLGLYIGGMKYIKHFFQPTPVFVILNIIEEVAKPITLAFRLFGNILAGEILIHILLQLLGNGSTIPSVIWLAFSVFVGIVQALVFTMLSTAYIGAAIKTDGGH